MNTKRSILVIAACMAMSAANAQLKVLQTGKVTLGGGNSPFPYTHTALSINGSASLKSSLEVMNLNNAATGWGGQIRFTANNLSGINHVITDNGVNELILYPGLNNGSSSRHVQIYGGLNVTGYSALAGGGYFSDERLKTNITPLEGSLDRIMKLRGVQYNWDRTVTVMSGDQKVSLTEGLPTGTQIGFIAQEMEKVVPEVVNESTIGYKTLEYHTLTALLVNAMQEQQKQIEQLESKLSMLQAGEVASGSAVRIGQNYPNPFDGKTVIEYDLPEGYGQAELMITDLQGKKQFSLPLETGSAKKIEVSSEQLAEGIFIYSIVSKGEVLASRQFIVTKR